jgi:hypothetical protein
MSPGPSPPKDGYIRFPCPKCKGEGILHRRPWQFRRPLCDRCDGEGHCDYAIRGIPKTNSADFVIVNNNFRLIDPKDYEELLKMRDQIKKLEHQLRELYKKPNDNGIGVVT